MKQKTCAIKDSFDAVKFLDEVKGSSDYIKAKSVLVNVFTERIQSDYIEYLSGLIKNKLDKAKIAGLTCLTGFAHGECFQEATILTILFFYESEIEILEYDFSKIPAKEAKKSLLEKLNSYSGLQGIQVYTTPLKNNGTNDFLSTINFEHTEVPIFGAGAGYEIEGSSRTLYVFGNGIYENGIIIILFIGEKLRIYAESTLGWTPIGKELTVSEVEGCNILKKIENEEAGKTYEKYLGVTSAENFIQNTCEFPFMLRRGKKWIARMPIKKDEQGAIHFTADIQKGEKLMFSYGSKKLILQKAFNLAEYMSRKNLDGLLLHVCRNRFTYLKGDEILELQAFSNFYRETAGCYAFAEILYKNKSGGLQNSALVAIGFREFESTEENLYAEDCYIEESIYENSRFIDINKIGDDISLSKKKQKILPFEERLVNFLHATSRDLYLANQKLEEAATIDGLTKIFNRKKISERISYELKKVGGNNISLIMFDIDNFKRINDTYGHDTGDEVLVRIASTAKACLREEDSIGRWGGEEFMVLLPEGKKEEAVKIAEKIRKSIHALQWEKMPQISVSLGLSCARNCDDLQTFYKRVDTRLYYAKTHGKNQVIYEDKD